MGSILTMIMCFMILVFSFQKVEVWIMKKGVDIASATEDSAFDDDYQFSLEKDGLNFAIAFTAYDNETEPILHPEYGKLIFNSWSWGFTNSFKSERKILPSHSCDKTELGLDKTTSSSPKKGS